jgi:hypothetical protein
MGSREERDRFVEMVRKSCRIMGRLRELGVRPYGVIRIDSAASPGEWAKDPAGNTKLIAETFARACDVAEDHGERPGLRGRDLLGRHAFVEGDARHAGGDRPPRRDRLSGGHGAYAALHHGLQRAGGAAAARGLRLVRRCRTRCGA